MIDLDELEKGLVCLVPKNPGPDCMLPTCHEYSVCDCKVLDLISEIRKLREANGVMKEALDALSVGKNRLCDSCQDCYDAVYLQFENVDLALAKAAKIMGEK